eukprot:TRINITY_DN8529_c0_g1_i1.p2 TRINITY_DN8529_c0_g1~~TRINITY_DN8529_c0_g1_i1.p2  ORF type:complete len:105 (+),score=7.76 TRINITY_DN8529_c0_g1_i1:416-730(+)
MSYPDVESCFATQQQTVLAGFSQLGYSAAGHCVWGNAEWIQAWKPALILHPSAVTATLATAQLVLVFMQGKDVHQMCVRSTSAMLQCAQCRHLLEMFRPSKATV